MHSVSYEYYISGVIATILLHMNLRKALLLVMARWQVTGYRLSQVSGVDKSLLAKLLRGESQSASWDKVEKLANGFEQIDPIAKDAFIGALQRQYDPYPDLTEEAYPFWVREEPTNIGAVMAVLDQYELLNRENIEKLRVELVEQNDDLSWQVPEEMGVVQTFIGLKMLQIRRKQEGPAQNA